MNPGFRMNYNGTVSQHYRLLSETKQQYRQIFQEASGGLKERLAVLQGQYACPQCDFGESDAARWFEPLHAGCGYRGWQREALCFIEQDMGKAILGQLAGIEAYKNTFSCHMCGMCCRLASSEYSYDELKTRAAQGDDFARQFSSIFLPYQSREAARQVAPEVVDAVLAEAGAEDTSAEGQERIYFYHCPYVGEDNRCSVYGTNKRPAICASYPETPLSFVYEKCAWKGWKDETHADTLAAHALLALCTDWAAKLKQALAD